MQMHSWKHWFVTNWWYLPLQGIHTTCETDVHTMTGAAQTSNDGSLKVLTTSDAEIEAMWDK